MKLKLSCYRTERHPDKPQMTINVLDNEGNPVGGFQLWGFVEEFVPQEVDHIRHYEIDVITGEKTQPFPLEREFGWGIKENPRA